MNAYDVRLSEPAEVDLDALILRQARFSHASADRLHEALLSAFRSLSQIPGRCPLAPENALFQREVRHLIRRHGGSTYRTGAAQAVQNRSGNITLSDRDFLRFVEQIENPPPPMPELREAMAEYRRLRSAQPEANL